MGLASIGEHTRGYAPHWELVPAAGIRWWTDEPSRFMVAGRATKSLDPFFGPGQGEALALAARLDGWVVFESARVDIGGAAGLQTPVPFVKDEAPLAGTRYDRTL